MKKIFLFLIIMGFSNFVLAQRYIGPKKQIERILNLSSKFSEYIVAGDFEAIANSYTDDGKIFPNNRMIIEGKEGLLEYWTLPEGISTETHKVTPSEIRIVGKTAYDYGYYEGSTRQQDGNISTWKGKYVIVWKKEGKTWKMYLDIWNRINN